MTEFDYNPDVASSIYSVQQALDGDVYKTIDKILKKTTTLLNLQDMFRQELLSSSVDKFTKR